MSTLYLRVIEARDLPRSDVIGSSDPYCIIKLKGSRERLKTQIIQNTTNPMWNQDFVLYPRSPNDVLVIKVWDKDIGKPDDLLGKLEIPLGEFMALPGTTNDIWRSIHKRRLGGLLGYKNRGQIHLSISYGQPNTQQYNIPYNQYTPPAVSPYGTSAQYGQPQYFSTAPTPFPPPPNRPPPVAPHDSYPPYYGNR